MGSRVNIPFIDHAISYCINEDPVLSLVEMICGCPVSVNHDKNPFQERPEDLSENTWYRVCSDQIRYSEAGFWRAEGDPRRMIFPESSSILCWEITHVFCERNDRETDWKMLEYNITITNGTFSICRIWQEPKNHAQADGILPDDSDPFSGGDFLELLDLEVPLFPQGN